MFQNVIEDTFNDMDSVTSKALTLSLSFIVVLFNSFKMISFEFNLMHLRVLGILPLAFHPILRHPFFVNLHRVLVSFAFLFLQIPQLVFMFLHAKSFEVYASILTTMAVLALPSLFYWCFLWNRTNLMNCIDELRELIQKSEFGKS